LIGYDATAAIRMKRLQPARPSGEVAQLKTALTPATPKSFGGLQHDHAGMRKTGLRQRVQSTFFSVISRGIIIILFALIYMQQEPPLSCFLGVIDCLI
jgi:hypothetical protein